MKSLFPRIFPVLVIVSLMLASCNMPDVTPAQIPTPTAILAASPTSAALPSDDVWDRIMANKKIVVGTAWDYPPFSSVDPSFKVVGFDIVFGGIVVGFEDENLDEFGKVLYEIVDAGLGC